MKARDSAGFRVFNTALNVILIHAGLHYQICHFILCSILHRIL